MSYAKNGFQKIELRKKWLKIIAICFFKVTTLSSSPKSLKIRPTGWDMETPWLSDFCSSSGVQKKQKNIFW